MARISWRPSLSTEARARRRLRLLVPVVLALAFPATLLAGHQFTDVPDTHFFHAQIANIRGAGITDGCGGGNYCPDNAVTRAQMAGFLNRGLGRATADGGSIMFTQAATTYVSAVHLTTGGVPGGTGFVTVIGSVTAWTETAGTCPCEVAVSIDRGAPYIESSPVMYFDISDTDNSTGARTGSATVSWVFQVDSAKREAFFLAADISTTGPAVGTVEGALTATYQPFGSTGSSTLSPGMVP